MLGNASGRLGRLGEAWGRLGECLGNASGRLGETWGGLFYPCSASPGKLGRREIVYRLSVCEKENNLQGREYCLHMLYIHWLKTVFVTMQKRSYIFSRAPVLFRHCPRRAACILPEHIMEMALTLKRQRKRPCALTAARQVIGRETTSAHRQKRKIQDAAVNREEKGLASGKGPFAERRGQI